MPSTVTSIAFWLVLAGPLAMAAASQRPTAAPPVIVDTDAGSDDLMAIAFLLARPDVRIDAITVCNGLAHVEPGAANIRRLVALGGQPEIPVFAGRATALRTTAEFPDAWRKVSDELPGVDLPQAFHKGEPRRATEYLVDRLGRATRPVRVLAQGDHDEFAEMSLPRAQSSYAVTGLPLRTQRTQRPDISKLCDLGDLCGDFRDSRLLRALVTITVAFLDDFRRRAATPLGRFVAQVLETDRAYIEGHFFFAWDPLAAVALVDGSVLKMARRAIAIDGRPPHEGRTRLVEGAPANVTVGEDADAAAFTRIFLSAFTKR